MIYPDIIKISTGFIPDIFSGGFRRNRVESSDVVILSCKNHHIFDCSEMRVSFLVLLLFALTCQNIHCCPYLRQLQQKEGKQTISVVMIGYKLFQFEYF